MKRIKDERLVKRNLNNIRIAFGVENVVLFILLIIQAIQEQTMDVFSLGNPLALVLWSGAFPILILSSNVSVPMEDKEKMPLAKIIGISIVTGFIGWFLFSLGPDGTGIFGMIGGITLAITILLVLLYQNRFRNESNGEDEI